MDRLRFTNGAAAVGMDRDGERGGRAKGHLLYAQDLDVLTELCARRLGYT